MNETRTLSDMIKEPGTKQYWPLEAIAADIDKIDQQINELNKVKEQLTVEHEETAEALGLKVAII